MGTDVPPTTGQDLTDEPLREFDSASPAPLTLMPRTSGGFSEYWLLEQGDDAVAAIKRSAEGGRHRARLFAATESWDAEARRRRRRLGWYLEFMPVDGREPAACYYPFTVRYGGRLELPGGYGYRLRGRLFRSHWSLVAEAGGELARIPVRTHKAATSGLERPMRIALTANASSEPRLLLLLLASCAAVLLHGEQPSMSGR